MAFLKFPTEVPPNNLHNTFLALASLPHIVHQEGCFRAATTMAYHLRESTARGELV